MQDKNNALNYVRFNVIAPPTVFTNSYYSIPVVYATGAGSGTTDLGDLAIFMSIFDNSSLVDSRLSAVETKTQGQTATSSLTTFIHPISMNSNKITNLASASNATDAVNKFYVDEAISNYLLIDDAISTYLNKTDAGTTYLALSGGTITGNLYSTCTDATTINYKLPTYGVLNQVLTSSGNGLLKWTTPLSSVSNGGTGTSLLTSTTNTLRGLVAGNAMAINASLSDITITNNSPASTISLTNASVGGNSILSSSINPTFSTKGLIAGTGMTITSNSTDLTLNGPDISTQGL